MELQTAMACTSSVHCVPVHYDGSFISTEESVIPAEVGQGNLRGW